MNEYKQIYIQEAGELLQQMNSSLLVLEKDPKNFAALNSIFRSAHTLKSMSASMGYRDIADLSHKMEDLLSELRSGAIDAGEGVIDVLFKSFDCLEAMSESVQVGKEFERDVRPLIKSLGEFMLPKQKIYEEKISETLNLNEYEKRALAKAKKDGYSTYEIKVVLDKNCVLKSVRAFMIFRNLHSIGEVIKSIPNTDALEEEKFEEGFECVFITKEKELIVKDKVFEILDVADVEIKNIEVNDTWDMEPAIEQSVSEKTHYGEIAQTDLRVQKMQSVRVDIARLDKLMNLVEELAINRLRLAEAGSKIKDRGLESAIEGLSRLTDDLQNEVMQVRLVPVGQVFDRFPRLVRDLAKKEGKKIKFDLLGRDIELDRTLLDEIGDPLIHLLRNAIDHGIEMPEERKAKGKHEEGRIVLLARREKYYVFIDVSDDGRGMNIEEIRNTAVNRGLATHDALNSMTEQEILMLATNPNLSTKKEVTELSGRGVGLDVVKSKAEALGGSITIESKFNHGCKITMRLPITTAVVKALLVENCGTAFAVPISSVVEIVVASEDKIKKVEDMETILHRGNVLPILRGGDLFQRTICGGPTETENRRTVVSGLNIVIVENGGKMYGITVDRLLRQQDIVVKQLTKDLRGIRGLAGATILGDGKVALVIDVGTVV